MRQAGAEVVVELPEELEIMLRLSAFEQVAAGAAVRTADVDTDAIAFVLGIDGKA